MRGQRAWKLRASAVHPRRTVVRWRTHSQHR